MIPRPMVSNVLRNARKIMNATRSTVMTIVAAESPSPKENGSRIASISQLRPLGDVASTASTWATLSREALWKREKADDGDRTRDPQLGKLMLYQLSYVRAWLNDTEGRSGPKRGSNEGVTADHACSRFAAAAAIASRMVD